MDDSFSDAMVVDVDLLASNCTLDRVLTVADALRNQRTAVIALTDRRRCDILRVFPTLLAKADALLYEHGAVTEVNHRVAPRCAPLSPVIEAALHEACVPVVPGDGTLLVTSDQSAAAFPANWLRGFPVRVLETPVGTLLTPVELHRGNRLRDVCAELGVPVDRLVHVDCSAAIDRALHRDEPGAEELPAEVWQS